MKFRTDLAFLRTIAVLLVVFYHFEIPYFEGGILGVDIFFVISGYLMSKIILKGFEENTFSLIEFYKKRAIRIIPPLLFLIFILFFVATFFIKHDQEMNARYATVSQLFISNWFYLGNSDYFDATSNTNLFQHTWSLSIEWQFYILFPILLILLKSIYLKYRNLFIIIIISLFSISLYFFFNYITDIKIAKAFNSLQSRYWELLIGLFIFVFEGKFNKIKTNIRKGLSILGILLIVFVVIIIDGHKETWPQYVTVLAVLGSSLVLVANDNNKLFKSNLNIQIAKYSYSIYLWHWPIFILFYNYCGFEYSYTYTLILIIIVSAFAFLSYHLIEKNVQKFNYKFLIAYLIILFINIITFKIPQLNFNKKNYPIEIENQDTISKQYRMNDKCHCLQHSKYIYNDSICLSPSPIKKNVLLFGDSHAGQFATAFKEYYESKNNNFMQATFNGRIPLTSISSFTSKDEIIYNKIVKMLYEKKIDFVIISAYYYKYKDIYYVLDQYIEVLEKANIPFIILGQYESYRKVVRDIFAYKKYYNNLQLYNFIDHKVCYEELYKRYKNKGYINLYKKISPKDEFGNLYINDDDHYTYYGANAVIKYLDSIKAIKGL